LVGGIRNQKARFTGDLSQVSGKENELSESDKKRTLNNLVRGKSGGLESVVVLKFFSTLIGGERQVPWKKKKMNVGTEERRGPITQKMEGRESDNSNCEKGWRKKARMGSSWDGFGGEFALAFVQRNGGGRSRGREKKFFHR